MPRQLVCREHEKRNEQKYNGLYSFKSVNFSAAEILPTKNFNFVHEVAAQNERTENTERPETEIQHNLLIYKYEGAL